MKKTLSLILALTLICSVLSACDIGKTPSESVGLEYEVNPDGKTCTITGIGTCKDTDLVIPSTIDGYSVTRIGYMAFYNCSELMSLIVPDSVTSIGNAAFRDCSGLTSITIPDSVTSVGDYAFAWCDSLTSIMFNGTKVQWNYFIRKGSYWNNNTGDYTIHCADGDLKK